VTDQRYVHRMQMLGKVLHFALRATSQWKQECRLKLSIDN